MADTVSEHGEILVTGGARGIGRAIVNRLSKSGYDVFFVHNRSTLAAEEILGDLRERFPNQSFLSRKVDLTDREQVEQLAAELEARPALYGFVHNAGKSYDALSALMDQDQAENLMQLNFWAMTRLVRAIIRPMMGARRGRIIGIGSVTALRGVTGNAAYAASKGAMMSYIRTLAIESARRDICVNYIAPGFVETNLLEPYREYWKQMESQIPLGRFAKPEEIAGLVEFLLSPSGAYMTGSIIQIDGGLDAGLAVLR